MSTPKRAPELPSEATSVGGNLQARCLPCGRIIYGSVPDSTCEHRVGCVLNELAHLRAQLGEAQRERDHARVERDHACTLQTLAEESRDEAREALRLAITVMKEEIFDTRDPHGLSNAIAQADAVLAKEGEE